MEEIRKILPASELMEALSQAVQMGACFPLTVSGDSMAPTLRHGRDTVVLTKADTVRRGDIVLIRRESGDYILHRVVKCQGDQLTLSGDAQLWTEQTERARVIAVASQIRRKGKVYDQRRWRSRAYSLLMCALRPVRGAVYRLYEVHKKRNRL